jgi:hypothetical protein
MKFATIGQRLNSLKVTVFGGIFILAMLISGASYWDDPQGGFSWFPQVMQMVIHGAWGALLIIFGIRTQKPPDGEEGK